RVRGIVARTHRAGGPAGSGPPRRSQGTSSAPRSSISRRRTRIVRAIPFIGNRRLLTFAAALAIALPAPVLAAAGSGGATPPGSPSYVTASPAYVASSGVVAGVEIKALVNS